MSTKTRLWVLVTALLCVLLVIFGVLAGLLPQLANATLIRNEASNTQLLIDTQGIQLERLQEADRNAEDLAAQLAELEVAIPTSADWPRFLRELQGIQAATGAVVTEVKAEPGVAPEPEAAPAATDPAAEAPAAGGAETTTPTDTAASGENAPAPSNLVKIPLNVVVSGSPEQVVEFLRQLQVGGRLFLLSDSEVSVSTGSGEDATTIATGTVNGFIYVVP